MKLRSPALLKLAERYENSAAGRHGGGRLDLQTEIEDILAAAGCAEGEARELAERDLRAARDAGVISLIPIHRREPNHFARIRLAPDNEEAFFAYLGIPSPTAKRVKWAELFAEAQQWPVPARFAEAWREFCLRRTEAAHRWRGMKPFDRDDLPAGRELLKLLPKLLAWKGSDLIRWASSVICRNSKFLERRQKTLEPLLAEATANAAPTYESLGIIPVPAGVTFHGPLRLRIGGEWRDFRDMHGATLSGADVERITECECTARRCLTVENATPFHSLVHLQSGELLIRTSYPNEATLALLRYLSALPTPLEFWHFGDTDPSGYHILADLRERSGIPFRAFRMRYRPSTSAPLLTTRERVLIEELIGRMPQERGELEAMVSAGTKGDFEQESLKPPTHKAWPFYDEVE